MAFNLNQFYRLRVILLRLRARWLRAVVGVDVDPTVQCSLSSRLRPGLRGGIAIGPRTLVAFKTLIYSRDPRTGEHRPVRIGSHCFIGGGATILPGVTVGDGTVVAAGAVVFDDVPPDSIAAGNPARIIRRGISAGPYGRLKQGPFAPPPI